MTHDTTEGVAESIAIWEERAAERILGEAVYEKRLKLYAEIYEHDNAFWLHRHGRIGISGATARNPALLQKAIPGDDPVLDIGGGTGVAGDAFSPTREYVICDASSVANAQSSSGLANRRTVIGNATELPFPTMAAPCPRVSGIRGDGGCDPAPQQRHVGPSWQCRARGLAGANLTRRDDTERPGGRRGHRSGGRPACRSGLRRSPCRRWRRC